MSLRAQWLGGLPKRDLLLLPAVVLFTVCATLVAAELGTRLIWPVVVEDSCGLKDRDGVYRFQPNCQSSTRSIDGPVVENQYNECGYRSPGPCAPTAPGALRVAVIGTSIGYGYALPYADSFAGIAADRLRKTCSQPVDVQDSAMPGDTIIARVREQVQEALPLKPSAFVMTISDFEVSHLPLGDDTSPAQKAAAEIAARPSLRQQLEEMTSESRLLGVLRYFRYLNLGLDIDNFLTLNTDRSDFMRTPLTALWIARLKVLDELLNGAAARARDNDIPFILVFVPTRVQTALTKPDYARPGLDPNQLNRQVQEIAARAGIIYIDATPGFGAVPDMDRLFLISKAHPAKPGHTLIADAVVSALKRLPAFSSCNAGNTPAPKSADRSAEPGG